MRSKSYQPIAARYAPVSVVVLFCEFCLHTYGSTNAVIKDSIRRPYITSPDFPIP